MAAFQLCGMTPLTLQAAIRLMEMAAAPRDTALWALNNALFVVKFAFFKTYFASVFTRYRSN